MVPLAAAPQWPQVAAQCPGRPIGASAGTLGPHSVCRSCTAGWRTAISCAGRGAPAPRPYRRAALAAAAMRGSRSGPVGVQATRPVAARRSRRPRLRCMPAQAAPQRRAGHRAHRGAIAAGQSPRGIGVVGCSICGRVALPALADDAVVTHLSPRQVGGRPLRWAFASTGPHEGRPAVGRSPRPTAP